MKGKEADPWTETIREQFEQSVNRLPGETVSRITRIRYSALEQTGQRSGPGYWLPAGAVATACLALLVYVLTPQQTTVEEKVFIDEIEIITELDFYENLEFYEWLEHYELPT